MIHQIRPISRARLAAWGLAFAVSALAGAATAGAPADPESAISPELVVTAHYGGPAWWRVAGPKGAVYILGVPEAAPKHLAWDQTLARRRLTGASELITPPQAAAGLGDIFALFGIRKHFRSKTPLEQGLPPELRARFLADRAKVSRNPRAYSDWTPLAATVFMVGDFRKQAGLDENQPAGAISRLARDLGVRVNHAAVYKAAPILRSLEADPAGAGVFCLAGALDEVEAGPDHARAAAEGWARGDVATALSAQRGYEKCVNSLPGGAELATRAMADTTNAIAVALGHGGHAVAVVNLRTLLARGGVLQQLRARGFNVTAPGPG